ncbi:MAG: sugar-binding domain-containing protein [Pseudomonadota bacterium]
MGGLTQSEVARRLDVPTTRAHRYIARAQSDGLVRVFVDVESADCVALEWELSGRYGLSFCRVAMDVPEQGPLPLRALRAVGADHLMRTVASGHHSVIGVGNGRTLAAAVDGMGKVAGAGTRFVSMLGGLTRSGAANPYDVIHRLSEKTGADAYLMPAPLYADSATDKNVMMAQAALAVTMGLIDDASLVVVGIGDLDPAGGAAPATALRSEEELAALRGAGARAEILGQFLDGEGRILKTPTDPRVMAPPLEALRGRDVLAIAGGLRKKAAIRAALESGLINAIIIDEATARSLVKGLGSVVAA